MRRAQEGVALLVVLWACTLLAILLGGYAAQVRIESEQARYAIAVQKSRYAAEAGVMKAIHDIYVRRKSGEEPDDNDDGSSRWIGNGRPFRFRLGDSRVEVRFGDELGKVDLNLADPGLLASLFLRAGADPQRAIRIADEVVAWRTHRALPDEDAIQRYRAAGLSYVPRGAPFPSVEELQSVLGMDGQLFARVQPALTLWSKRATPVPYYASVLVLSALPNVTVDAAKAYVEQRERSAPGSPLSLTGSAEGGWQFPSNVVTIESKGVSTDDISTTLQVTVSFNPMKGAIDPSEHLYTVLRWQEVPR